jgi:hypothetical protein
MCNGAQVSELAEAMAPVSRGDDLDYIRRAVCATPFVFAEKHLGIGCQHSGAVPNLMLQGDPHRLPLLEAQPW